MNKTTLHIEQWRAGAAEMRAESIVQAIEALLETRQPRTVRTRALASESSPGNVKSFPPGKA